MHRRRAYVVVLLLSACLAATRAYAQDTTTAQSGDDVERFVGKTVMKVSLAGETGRPETSALLASLVEVKEGEPLRIESLRSSLAHLYTVGRLEDASIDVTDVPGGVDVVFKLVPSHPIDKLEFTGDTGLSPSVLGQLVKDRFGGRLPSNVPRFRVQAVVKSLLADEGFQSPQVSTTTQATHDPDRATLVIHIDSGARTYLANVSVTGASPMSEAKVIEKTAATRGTAYRPRALDAGLAAVRDELRAQGYYEATATAHATPSEDHTSVDLTLAVDAGSRVQLVWAGDPRPAGDVEDYVPIRREGSADEDLLDDSDRRIEVALKRDGYRNAQAVHTRVLASGQLVVTFTITRGRRFRIDHVEVTGNTGMTAAEIDQQLALAPGDLFFEDRVELGGRKTVLEYQRRGFYTASIQPVFEELPVDAPADGRVLVRLAVSEGPKGTVTDVQITGAKIVPDAEVRAQMRSMSGSPFVISQVNNDRDNVEVFYRNLGFQAVNVTIKPTYAADGRSITLLVDIAEGPQIIVQDIRIVGNRRVASRTITELLKLHEGAPLGEADRLDSTRALQSTGSFRSVSITEEPLLPGETNARVLVTVDEAPATTIAYGGGVEAGRRTRLAAAGGVEDFFEVAPRGSFEINRRNLWGKNRSVDFFSRLSLRPRSAPNDPTRDGRGLSFSEYLLKTTYRSQHAFHSDTDLQVGASTERGIRTSFNFVRNAFTAEALRRLTARVSVTGRYSLDFTSTNIIDANVEQADKLLIDRAFPNVRLSTISTGAVWDRRDSPVAPTRGVFMSGDGDLAMRAIGSEVGFAKTFLQMSAFRPVTASHRVVLAGRAQVGLARGFARSLTIVTDGVPQTEIVEDLPISQRFFAGGGTTVRGFQQDRLGVPAIINSDGLSIGGNGLIVLNAEVRTVVGKLLGHNFGLVGFVDAGNVFAKAADVGLSDLRSALGVGFRYDSPLGPLRLDLGFKTDRRIIGGARERGWEYHLNLGEVF